MDALEGAASVGEAEARLDREAAMVSIPTVRDEAGAGAFREEAEALSEGARIR